MVTQLISSGSATPSTTAASSSLGNADVRTASSQTESNGNATDGESSKIAADGNTSSGYPATDLAEYIFNVGYLQQQWIDIQVSFLGTMLQGHRLVLARSPYLTSLMTHLQLGEPLVLPIRDPTITAESVHIALHHLYSPANRLVNPGNARAVLVTATLFEGMSELVEYAYLIWKQSLGQDNILDNVNWLGAGPSPPSQRGQFGSSVQEGGNAQNGWSTSNGGGDWTERLRADCLDFLIQTLPSDPTDVDARLLPVYSKLPFELFKLCVESPDFPMTSTQARFAFTKKAIAQRKKMAAAEGMEESVVLDVAEQQGAVHVIRKPKRSRAPLWKVEG